MVRSVREKYVLRKRRKSNRLLRLIPVPNCPCILHTPSKARENFSTSFFNLIQTPLLLPRTQEHVGTPFLLASHLITESTWSPQSSNFRENVDPVIQITDVVSALQCENRVQRSARTKAQCVTAESAQHASDRGPAFTMRSGFEVSKVTGARTRTLIPKNVGRLRPINLQQRGALLGSRRPGPQLSNWLPEPSPPRAGLSRGPAAEGPPNPCTAYGASK